MTNWVHSEISHPGSREVFLRAMTIREQRNEPVRSRNLAFDDEDTAVVFDTAWSADIEMAWILSFLEPDSLVCLTWMEPINCYEGRIVLRAGRPMDIRCRMSDSITRWSRAAGVMREFLVVYDDCEMAPHGTYTEQLISEAYVPLLSITDIIPDCEPLDPRLLGDCDLPTDERGARK